MSEAAEPDDQVLKHGIFLTIVLMLANVANIGFQAVMGWKLDDANYGVLMAMLQIVMVFTTPMEALRTAAAHYSERLLKAGRILELRHFIQRWLVEISLAALPLLVLGLVFREQLAQWCHLTNSMPIVMTLIILAVALYMPFLIGLLQGLQAFGWMALVMHGWTDGRLLAGWLFLILLGPTDFSGLLGQLGGVVLSLVIGFIGLAMVLPRRQPVAPERVAGVHRYVAWSFMIQCGYALLLNADTVIVKHYFDPVSAGLFARVSLIGRSIVFLVMPFALAIFPKVASQGEMSAESLKILRKALFSSFLMCGAATLFCTFFPQLPLKLLSFETEATQELRRMIVAIVWAMLPLGIAYLLANFELAQHRFRAAMSMPAASIVYVVGCMFLHDTPMQIVFWLGLANTLCCLIMAGDILIRRKKC